MSYTRYSILLKRHLSKRFTTANSSGQEKSEIQTHLLCVHTQFACAKWWVTYPKISPSS